MSDRHQHPTPTRAAEITDTPGRVESLTTAALTRAEDAAMVVSGRSGGWDTAADDAILRDPPARWYGQGPVVLVGGYAVTDPVLEPMASWLEHLGYDVMPFTTGSGIGCASRVADGLAAQLHQAADDAGAAPVRVVGHSRGGQFARVAAHRVLDEIDVAGLVTLGAPFESTGLRWPLLAQVTATGVAGSLGVPGLFSLSCLYGRCCARYRDEVRSPWPAHIPFTSIHGSHDAAVPKRSSIDRYARNVEIDAGHLSLLTSPTAFAATAEALVGRPAVADGER